MARRLATSSTIKTLLPPPTLWGTISSAFQGAASIALDDKDRIAMETMLRNGSIQDAVLQNSEHDSEVSPGGMGSLLVFSLFDSLQHNPLWKKHGFDILEFKQAVAPAVGNFFDLLHQVQEQEAEKMLAQGDELFEAGEVNESEEGQKIELNVKNPELLSQGLQWRETVEKEPDSTLATLAQMTTPPFLDSFFQMTTMEFMSHQLFQHTTLSLGRRNQYHPSFASKYVPGSSRVDQVAILRARALELEHDPYSDEEVDHRYEEFKATTDPNFDKDKPIGAQIDVLCEITSRCREKKRSLSESDGLEQLKAILGKADPVEKQDEKEKEEEKEEEEEELVEYTHLAVAVLEGWLYKEKEELQWRVSVLREPIEFSVETPVVRTVLDPKEEGSSSIGVKTKSSD